MLFGIVVFPMAWSRHGKTQEFFDEFKAGHRTHKMGLFRGAVFHHGGVPTNCPSALTGHLPSLMGRFPTLILVSDSVKRHLRGRHLSVLNLKFDFISDGGCTREEQIALSLKRHLFPHGGREPKAFWICFSRVRPPSEIKSNFKFKTLKRHLLKQHLTLSDGLGAPKVSE